MKLSTRTRYALRAMLTIAKSADGSKPVSLQAIAKSTQLSRRYLEQLAIALKKARLVRGINGEVHLKSGKIGFCRKGSEPCRMN